MLNTIRINLRNSLPKRINILISRNRSAISTTQTEADLGSSEFSAMPTPRGLPLIGTTLSLMMAGSAANLHYYVDARHKELGPVFRETVGDVNAVFVSDPNEMKRVFLNEGRYPHHLLPPPWQLYNDLYDCKRGLFFMNGEEWLNFRRVMNRLLLKNEKFYDLFTPSKMVTENMIRNWGTLDELEDPAFELYKWSLDVLVAILIGENSYKNNFDKIDATIETLASTIKLVFEESSKLQITPAKLAMVLGLPSWKRFKKAVDDALYGVNTFLLELLDMAKGTNGLLARMQNAGLQTKDISKIVSDLILAAGDTTSYATLWGLYLLAKHPDQQQLIYDDIRKKGESDVRIKRAIKEALRLFPVATFVTRVLPEDCIIGGYNVPHATMIALSVFTSGRSEENFVDAERFWPERWARNETSQYLGVKHPYATLPFGFGVRSCIGRRLAELQMTQFFEMLIQNNKLELKYPEKNIELKLRLVGVPSDPISVRLLRR